MVTIFDILNSFNKYEYGNLILLKSNGILYKAIIFEPILYTDKNIVYIDDINKLLSFKESNLFDFIILSFIKYEDKKFCLKYIKEHINILNENNTSILYVGINKNEYYFYIFNGYEIDLYIGFTIDVNGCIYYSEYFTHECYEIESETMLMEKLLNDIPSLSNKVRNIKVLKLLNDRI